MNQTIKAILAKNGFNREAAIDYCYRLIDSYPHLRAEYTVIVDILTGHEQKANAATAGI